MTPYLTVQNGDAMIEFYRRALGADVLACHKVPETELIMHGALKVGDSVFFINDEFPDYGSLAPVSTGSTSSSIHIQVSEGLDELYAQALAAGATSLMEPADQFWGDRFAMFVDPSGHRWSIGMVIQNPPVMTPEELRDAFGPG